MQTYRGYLLKDADASQDQMSENVDCGSALYGSFEFTWTGLTGVLDAVAIVEVSNSGGHWDAVKDASGNVATILLDSADGGRTISISGILTEGLVRANYSKNDVTGGTVSCLGILKE